jgi:hypothetical protein
MQISEYIKIGGDHRRHVSALVALAMRAPGAVAARIINEGSASRNIEAAVSSQSVLRRPKSLPPRHVDLQRLLHA